MCLAITTKACLSCSVSPHWNIKSSTSCMYFVMLGPRADASMAMHWKMGFSSGAFFLLLILR